ncbi:uncharacterized protein LOC127519744 isoform X3 [Ctenopharyngodon idella]|nr:uncharacterized protein LOC127519744 isoform X3 [Ctenopharyngodon idella]
MKKEVTEGNSLTLPTALTKTQSSDQIFWLYGPQKTIIAKIARGIYETGGDERFEGNLELDKQTGSLTIKNIRIINTGLYQLDFNGAVSREFSVTVYARLPTPEILSPQCAQTPAGSSSPKCVFQCSVQTSDQVTLSWYKGNSLVSSNISNICSRISLPLEVNYEDKNPYSCMVNNPISNKTKHLDITQLCHRCDGSGLSPWSVVGISIGVFLVVVVLAAAGLYNHFKPEMQIGSIIPETVKCVEGTFASLPSGVVEVRSGDQMLWTFENEKSPIATMSKNDKKTYFYDDKRFRGRLQLDHQTGSLIIRNLRKTDSGVYLLQIKSTGGTTYRKYKVILNGKVETVSVKEGSDVTLPFVYPIKDVDHLKWQFGEERSFIALLIKEDNELKYSGERFIDRLDLDKQTGSLTIKNIRPEHTGIYTVKISSLILKDTFNVIFDDSTEASRNESMNTGFMGRIQKCCGLSRNRGVFRDEKDEMKTLTVEEGGVLILNTDTQIQTDDEILLRFGTSFAKRRPYVTIARFSKQDEFKSSERGFKERLRLDLTGPLTITIKNIKFTDYGDYYVQITNKRNKSFKSFTFIVVDPSGDAVESVQGKTVNLKTHITDIHKDDQILWTYGPHAMIIADSKDTSRCDKRFKERVVLDKETGFLTIKRTKTTDSGDYHLLIISSSRVRNQTFSVTVKDASTSLQITDDNPSDQNEGDAIRTWYDELDEMMS